MPTKSSDYTPSNRTVVVQFTEKEILQALTEYALRSGFRLPEGADVHLNMDDGFRAPYYERRASIVAITKGE